MTYILLYDAHTDRQTDKLVHTQTDRQNIIQMTNLRLTGLTN